MPLDPVRSELPSALQRIDRVGSTIGTVRGVLAAANDGDKDVNSSDAGMLSETLALAMDVLSLVYTDLVSAERERPSNV